MFGKKMKYVPMSFIGSEVKAVYQIFDSVIKPFAFEYSPIV
jgi:hypothetical protein